jgi:hypothetical protein
MPETDADKAKRAEDAAVRAEAAARRAEREREDASVLLQAAETARVAGRQASRFSREFVVTVFSVVTTAFGFVVALAWNTALSEWLSELQRTNETWGFFLYALLVTFLAVIAIILLTRLAQRMGARPIEFKLAAEEEEEKKK